MVQIGRTELGNLAGSLADLAKHARIVAAELEAEAANLDLESLRAETEDAARWPKSESFRLSQAARTARGKAATYGGAALACADAALRINEILAIPAGEVGMVVGKA